jgi:hypothetical protein
MKSIALIVCFAAHMLSAGEIRNSSDPVPVNTVWGAQYSSGDISLAFDPAYSVGADGDAAYVVLKKVVGFGTEAAVTSTVMRGEMNLSGRFTFPYSPSDSLQVRFLHCAYDADGKQVGEVLSADVVFPFANASSAGETFVDGRSEPLQHCANEAEKSNSPLSLLFAYDSGWATNAVPERFRLTQVCEQLNRSMEVLSSVTNVLLESQMPAVGNYAYTLNPNKGGRYTFFCTFFDSKGEPIGETCSASYYIKEKRGLVFRIK